MNTSEYSGVKIGKQKTDFIAGVNSPVIQDSINLSGNWDLFRPEHELQNRGFETYACAVFSALDCLETLFMFYLKQNLFSVEDVKWLGDKGYFNKGFINFSDRYASQFADIEIGTGTYIYKANDAVRKHLIPETLMPYKLDGYYNIDDVTEEMEKLNKEFQKRFTINWEYCKDFKKSPVQVIVKYATGDGILKPNGALNHAVMAYNEKDDHYSIDDSYMPRDKKYGKDFVFNFVNYTLTINNKINMDIGKFLTDNDLKFVRNQNTGAFGRVMQKKLRTIETLDRGTLCLLDNEHRKNGVSVTDDEWETLPKLNF